MPTCPSPSWRWGAVTPPLTGGPDYIWVLRDLGSRTGTWLNGALLLKPTRLLAGDLIRLGDTASFRFEAAVVARRLHRRVSTARLTAREHFHSAAIATGAPCLRSSSSYAR